MDQSKTVACDVSSSTTINQETGEEMTSKRIRDLCSTMTEVFQLTIQAQTRALLRSKKEKATKESVRLLMREDCAKLGISDLDHDLPPIVHVAGTKGMFFEG
jgi:hypothetical protein